MHSDGAYLVKPEAKSRDGGFFYQRNFVNDIEKRAPKLNGLMHVLCKILKNVVSSAAECEIASAFESGQDTTVLRRSLQETMHQQPSKLVQLDNAIVTNLTNASLKQKGLKA